MHKVAARHLATVKSGTIDRGTVIGIRKLVSSSYRAAHGYGVGGGQAKAPLEDMEAILVAIMEHKPVATGELHDNGLKVLRNPRHRKALAGLEHVLTYTPTFRLVDYELRGRIGDYFVPIWRAESLLGWFDFISIPWQSGGNGPEVLRSVRGRP